jgi:hypothetical protein
MNGHYLEPVWIGKPAGSNVTGTSRVPSTWEDGSFVSPGCPYSDGPGRAASVVWAGTGDPTGSTGPTGAWLQLPALPQWQRFGFSWGKAVIAMAAATRTNRTALPQAAPNPTSPAPPARSATFASRSAIRASTALSRCTVNLPASRRKQERHHGKHNRRNAKVHRRPSSVRFRPRARPIAYIGAVHKSLFGSGRSPKDAGHLDAGYTNVQRTSRGSSGVENVAGTTSRSPAHTIRSPIARRSPHSQVCLCGTIHLPSLVGVRRCRAEDIRAQVVSTDPGCRLHRNAAVRGHRATGLPLADGCRLDAEGFS